MDGRGRFLRSLTFGLLGQGSERSDFFVSSPLKTPLHKRIPGLMGTILAVGFLGAAVLVGFFQGGHAQTFKATYGEFHNVAARMMGFGVDNVTMKGLSHLREEEVLRLSGIDGRLSVPFLDVSEVRARLERVPLIRKASVRKLYPNDIMIELEERTPHALWQRNGEVFVISADGTVIDFFQDERFSHLPLVVGEGANMRTDDYIRLLQMAGPLKKRIKAGTLNSGRRWTLKMDNGLDIQLPETLAEQALTRLANLEKDQKILEKDIIAVDLRIGDRVVLRLTEEALANRQEIMKKRTPRGKGVQI